MRDFAKSPKAPAALFRDAVLQLEAFSTFLQILKELEDRGATHLVLGRPLSTRLGHPWKDGTAAIVAKVLLDWARHTGLAPSAFGAGRRRRRTSPEEPSLFEDYTGLVSALRETGQDPAEGFNQPFLSSD